MSYRDKYNMTVEDFELLRRNVEKTVPYYAGVQWKFSGSFYFALTVVTVIGNVFFNSSSDTSPLIVTEYFIFAVIILVCLGFPG
jgi:hypothetical protein